MHRELLERELAHRLRAGTLKVPPYPAVAARLAQLARQKQGASLNELVKVVSADAALAAQVLGRAQSSACTGGRAVTTLFEALSKVGIDQLVEMSLATGLGSAMMAPGQLAELQRDLWRRCLLSAQLARMLADNRSISPETAYSAGLVHDLGAAIVIIALEDIAKHSQIPEMSDDEWRTIVSAYRADAGLLIAKRWNLPSELAEVIVHSHDPSPTNPLLNLIHLSIRMVAKLDHMPIVGLAALMDFEELSAVERCSVGSVVQEVVKNMASYNVSANAPCQRWVSARPSSGQGLAVSFVVKQDQKHYRASEISTEAIVFNGASAMPLNWLVELALEHANPALTVLANIRTCDKNASGYTIRAQPFALGGEQRTRWMQLVDDAAGDA